MKMKIKKPMVLVGFGVLALLSVGAGLRDGTHGGDTAQITEGETIKVHYLEIVSSSVDATCKALTDAHGVTFSEPVLELGNARTAELKDGGRIGVRAPMSANEKPVVRPYVLVDDIEAAVKAAKAAGGQVAMSPTEIPGQGAFSIYMLGGIEHGLWQK